jgi:DNA-binding MarR family transcriptional regulator
MQKQLEIGLGYQIHDVTRLLRRAYDGRARKFGLTRAQWRIVAHLVRQDGQTQSGLAEELDMEPAPLGRLLDKLEKKGWISRRAVESDRRARQIFMTENFPDQLAGLKKEATSLYADALKGARKGDLDSFFKILEIMRDNLARITSE